MAPEYWKKRNYVGEQMMERLEQNLKKVHAHVRNFQLLDVTLPDNYEEAIVETQVVNQRQQTMIQIRNATNIKASINVDRSEAAKNITVINAQADANATIIENEAIGKMINNTITYEGEAYGYVNKELAFNKQESLVDYVKYMNLLSVKDSGAKLLVGADAIVNLK